MIVATNIAETSVTVPGVTAVVDSGLHKIARYDAARAIDSLDGNALPPMRPINGPAAPHGWPRRRARLWDARDRLRPHREPEIHRIDLSGTVLDIVSWGGDPQRFNGSNRRPGRRLKPRWHCWRGSGRCRVER